MWLSLYANSEGEDEKGFSGYGRDEKLPDLDGILKGEGTNSPPVKVTMTPGEQYAYSGGGAMILQKIIENLTKQKFEDVVKEKIFNPLEMNASGFSPPDSLKIHGNGMDGKPLQGGWVEQPELAAAGLWTTPEDLAKMTIAIQKSLKNEPGALLYPKSAQDLIQVPSGLKYDRGQIPGSGVFVEKSKEATYFHHDGSNLGFRCLMVGNDQGQGAVIMTNSELGNELIQEIVRKLADAYNWKGKDALNMVPAQHKEVLATTEKSEPIQGKDWAEKYHGSYKKDDHFVSLEFNEATGKIEFTDPGNEVFQLIPVSEHVGILNEDGKWFPVEFHPQGSGQWILSIHGFDHKGPL